MPTNHRPSVCPPDAAKQRRCNAAKEKARPKIDPGLPEAATDIYPDLAEWERAIDWAPRHRRNGWDRKTQARFLHKLAGCGSVAEACATVGRSRASAFLLRADPRAKGFAQGWDAAVALQHCHLVDLALTRAVHGTDRPIMRNGTIIGHWRKPDNTLLMKLIRHTNDPAGPGATPRPPSSAID
ncbi:hypothetical protein [Sandaracinobacteroides saxicola]|uniref:Uncharacterized protein n=1 Tax=Sandaracinobacteroides saxicola TaxID=2759707 RepID=A0A7G5ILW5_9SPHN|nr:hypothetical protein [Sandaracinobacteroides saxicola]QMW24357.1 hypothetical protein H3309_07870 [Sandaracinobacteroides saxicola]